MTIVDQLDYVADHRPMYERRTILAYLEYILEEFGAEEVRADDNEPAARLDDYLCWKRDLGIGHA